MADRDRVNEILHPELNRKDLTPAAREPESEHSSAGFGSYYPGPLQEDEDTPILGQAEPQMDEEEEHSLRVPRQAVVSGTEDNWPSAEARDFRRETPVPPQTYRTETDEREG